MGSHSTVVNLTTGKQIGEFFHRLDAAGGSHFVINGPFLVSQSGPSLTVYQLRNGQLKEILVTSTELKRHLISGDDDLRNGVGYFEFQPNKPWILNTYWVMSALRRGDSRFDQRGE